MECMNYSYRKATAADIPELMALCIRSYAAHAGVLGPDHWPAMEARLSQPAFYAEMLERATGFICTCDENPVGMVFVVPSGAPSLHFPEEWAHIRALGVAPEHTGKGIARTLMEHCIEEARNRGERTLALHTGIFMHAARKLYDTMGFRVDRELVPIYEQQYTRFRLDL